MSHQIWSVDSLKCLVRQVHNWTLCFPIKSEIKLGVWLRGKAGTQGPGFRSQHKKKVQSVRSWWYIIYLSSAKKKKNFPRFGALSLWKHQFSSKPGLSKMQEGATSGQLAQTRIIPAKITMCVSCQTHSVVHLGEHIRLWHTWSLP